MRDILFRGKPTKEVLENESLCKTLPIKDGFVYGNLIYNDKQPYIVGPIADVNDEYCSMEWWCPVEPETVGQFTGLVDRNGKRVFEGDILQWVDEDNTCEGSKLIFIVKFDGEYEGFFGEGEFDNIEPWQFRNHEVIGNIHDKPELLEVK